MIGEIDLQGVLVAPLLAWIGVAYVLSLVLRKGLDRIGFYRIVWHRALFDAALLVILIGLVNAGAHFWFRT